ncbi:MAG: hypothetical protein R3D00_05485 [Bacteroidia bacterium]
MNDLLAFRFSWTTFFMLGITLLGFFIMLLLVRRFLTNSPIARNFQKPVNTLITQLLVLFEPLAIILLTGTFIFINPGFHGALVLFILIIGFSHIRNYITGKLVWFNDSFSEGKIVSYREIQGIVSRKGALGLNIRTPEGIHHVSYTRLLADGYTIISDNRDSGKYSLLEVSPLNHGEKNDQFAAFTNLITTNPFINWNYKPELSYPKGKLIMKAFFREKNHLQDLVRVIGEWGYECKIIDES